MSFRSLIVSCCLIVVAVCAMIASWPSAQEAAPLPAAAPPATAHGPATPDPAADAALPQPDRTAAYAADPLRPLAQPVVPAASTPADAQAAAVPGARPAIADPAEVGQDVASDGEAPLPTGIPARIGKREVVVGEIEERDEATGRVHRRRIPIIADRVLVRLQPGVERAALDRLAQAHGATIERRLRVPGPVYELKLARRGAAAVRAAVDRFRSAAATVASAQPDVVYTIVGDPVIPDDEHFDNLWGMHNTGQSGGTDDADIDAPEAWAQTTGDDGIMVAVVDTGIDYTHPDLAANMWTNPGEIPDNGIDDDGNGYVDDVHGYDFINDDGDPMDDHFHGTHCAGTIGAVGDNGTGVAGVAWDVRLVAIKGLAANGSGTGSGLAECLAYAHAIGVDVTSNSWGGSYSDLVHDQIIDAGNHGVITVAAAGNATTDLNASPTTYPACINLPHVVTVAATDKDDAMSSFSNWGSKYVELGAPGSSIVSTMPTEMTDAMEEYDLITDYAGLSGTSMATPHVAGACVLAKAADPATTPELVRLLLMHTADVTDAMAGKVESDGRLNVATLVERAAGSFAVLIDRSLDDDAANGSDGNSDGMWEPGETIGLTLTLRNLGATDIDAVDLSLSSDDPAITVPSEAIAIGALGARAALSADEIALAIDPGATALQTVTITVTVNADGVEHDSMAIPVRIVDPAMITGTVTDAATGTGLAGVCVRGYGDLQTETYTDIDGTYSLRIPEGVIAVVALRRGYEPDSSTVTAPAADVDFSLHAWELRSVRMKADDHITYPYPMDMNAYGHTFLNGFTGLIGTGDLVDENGTLRPVASSALAGYYPAVLNDFGDVASRTHCSKEPALFDRDGLITGFHDIADRSTAVMTGINNAGQIAFYHSESGERRAWLVDPASGQATKIFSDTLSVTGDIDEDGRVYGYAVGSDDDDDGFIYDPADGSITWAHPVAAEHMHIFGASADGSHYGGVLIWDDGTVRGFVSDGSSLTTLPDPWGIQDDDIWHVRVSDVDTAGRAVGRYYHDRYRSDTRVAMLHLGDIPIDLNEVAPEDCDLVLQQAIAINEAGDISGYGVNQFGLGEPRNEIAFVFTRTERENLPPVARIKTVGRVPVDSDLELIGQGNDEGGDAGLSKTWSMLSGPGTASFADYSAWRTTVSFDTAGTYQLQLRVDDGAHQTDASCTVEVGSGTGNAAPTVTLSYVIKDDNIHTSWAGGGAMLTAAPADSDGTVHRVEFYDLTGTGDPVLLGSSARDPWEFLWQTWQAGTHRLRAKVYDDEGAIGWSETIEIAITKDTVPVITMTSPVNGQVFGQFESVVARATCDHPSSDLTRIYLYLNGDRHEGWTSNSDWPGTYEYTFDNLEPGKHIIHFQVIDLYDANTAYQGYHVMSEVAEITIGGQPAIAAPEVMANAMRGRSYGTRFTPSGMGPFTWSLDSGTLPAGLSLVADNGAIVGTPDATGSFPFTVAVENAFGTGSRNYVLEVLANVDRAIQIRASDGPWFWIIEPDDGPAAELIEDDTVFDRRSRFEDYRLEVDPGGPEAVQ